MSQDLNENQTPNTPETTANTNGSAYSPNSGKESICSLDIETLALTPDAVILSIGAVIVGTKDYFYMEAPPYNQFLRKTDRDTEAWWTTQKLPMPGVGSNNSLREVLEAFASWYKTCGSPQIWVRGADFDPVILVHAFKEYGLDVPWKYYKVVDLRSIEKVFGITPPTKYNTHHALADAIEQAAHIRKVLDCVKEFKHI